MQKPGLAHDGNHWRVGLKQKLHLLITLDRYTFPPGRSKSCQARVFEVFAFGLFEEFNVFGIGAWPTAFDVMNAEMIEFFRNAELVDNRKIYAFPLAAIA